MAKRGWIALGVGVAAAVAGVATERALVRRDRARPDPSKDEPYGSLRGEPFEVTSFDGTRIYGERFGSVGPTLVLSHGFSLNRTLWHHQCLDLATDRRVVAYDHRGHGLSARAESDDYSLDALARDMDAVVRACGDGPIMLVGHSMGGMALLTWCELFTERLGSIVDGIVLIDTTAADVLHGRLAPAGRGVTAAAQGVQEIVMRAMAGRARELDRIRLHGSGPSYLATRVMGFGRNPPPSQVDFVERMLASVPSDVWLRLMPAMMALDVTHVLADIKVPALVIAGERDRLTPPGAAERLARGLPDAELVVIGDAGHTPMLEAHARVTELLRDFSEQVA